MTDFRARGTIMGPTGLTAVFGMGTGVTPPVWSPEMPPGGGQAAPGDFVQSMVDHARESTARAVQLRLHTSGPPRPRVRRPRRLGVIALPRWGGDRLRATERSVAAPRGRGRRIGVVKRSAVGTGPLRRSPAVHSRPIDLVVFQEPSWLAPTETSSWRGLRA
jgi:hypothetical protein